MHILPQVALIGRPNVGKSTLFNRLIGKRQAVVADIAGTTRDRLEHQVEYGGRTFTLVDMAGIEPALKDANEISQGMQQQIEQALERAAVIIWVVDVNGLTHADELVAELLRRIHKPVVVAMNKADHAKYDDEQYEFSRFGFNELVAVSAIHSRGRDALLDAIVRQLPEADMVEAPSYADRELRISLAGRPNVGKSTLLNALTGENRSVVSAEGGTTRDAVDTVIPADNLFPDVFTRWRTVRIVDTAGIRRRGKIDRSIEGWSVLRSFDAIEDAHIILFVIDGSEELVHQDLQIAQRIVDAGRAVVLMINKWDKVLAKDGIIPGTAEDGQAQDRMLNSLRRQMPFMPWVQVLFFSAQTGLNLDVLGKLVNSAFIAWSKEIDQDELDELTEELKKMPRLTNLRRITFEHSMPPVFHVHVHGMHLPHFSTRRYIDNALRDYFDLGPTPIKIWVETSTTRTIKKD